MRSTLKNDSILLSDQYMLRLSRKRFGSILEILRDYLREDIPAHRMLDKKVVYDDVVSAYRQAVSYTEIPFLQICLDDILQEARDDPRITLDLETIAHLNHLFENIPPCDMFALSVYHLWRDTPWMNIEWTYGNPRNPRFYRFPDETEIDKELSTTIDLTDEEEKDPYEVLDPQIGELALVETMPFYKREVYQDLLIKARQSNAEVRREAYDAENWNSIYPRERFNVTFATLRKFLHDCKPGRAFENLLAFIEYQAMVLSIDSPINLDKLTVEHSRLKGESRCALASLIAKIDAYDMFMFMVQSRAIPHFTSGIVPTKQLKMTSTSFVSLKHNIVDKTPIKDYFDIQIGACEVPYKELFYALFTALCLLSSVCRDILQSLYRDCVAIGSAYLCPNGLRETFSPQVGMGCRLGNDLFEGSKLPEPPSAPPPPPRVEKPVEKPKPEPPKKPKPTTGRVTRPDEALLGPQMGDSVPSGGVDSSSKTATSSVNRCRNASKIRKKKRKKKKRFQDDSSSSDDSRKWYENTHEEFGLNRDACISTDGWTAQCFEEWA